MFGVGSQFTVWEHGVSSQFGGLVLGRILGIWCGAQVGGGAGVGAHVAGVVFGHTVFGVRVTVWGLW